MGHVTLTDGLAIWQLIYYIIALCCSLWVSAHHGFMKSSGWIFLTIFSIIRIISCSAQLATITAQSDTPVTISVITGFFGLSPLLLATLGIVSRVWYSILKTPWNIIFSLGAVRVVQLPAAIALILCIVGGVSADNPTEIRDQDTVKAGVILYLIVLFLLFLLVVGAAVARRKTERGEHRLLCAVAISLPVLLIRVIYSLLAVFSKQPVFAAMSGSTSSVMTELFMGRIEEMVVVLVYLWVGITQEIVPSHDDGVQRSKGGKFLYRAERGDFGTGKLGVVSLAAHAIITMLRGNKEDQSARHSDQALSV
ncbi:hypothetical protein B0J13DRAFT_596561 [Dactylonectria estremocensis]|uniref:DUF7702 domain-containing protein n=1 Tax=Dactylonectria estremocensis TaxID=1079267 RepID=A0A9P9EMN4_9HYPO|nr:hypothetical protein B0J13DRAFT_596561 [Dactylonectria estremocensis]